MSFPQQDKEYSRKPVKTALAGSES
jgi:hypothetical protein